MKYPKKCLGGFDNIFYVYLMRGFQKYGRNWILTVAFWGHWQTKAGLNWLYYFAGSSKSHLENSISFIFLKSPHQVDMKNVVKSFKHFFGYFKTLETHSALIRINKNKNHYLLSIPMSDPLLIFNTVILKYYVTLTLRYP